MPIMTFSENQKDELYSVTIGIENIFAYQLVIQTKSELELNHRIINPTKHTRIKATRGQE